MKVTHSAGIYLLTVNSKIIRTRLCSKLTIKTPERRHLSLTLIIFHLVPVFIVNFEQVIAGWVVIPFKNLTKQFFFSIPLTYFE